MNENITPLPFYADENDETIYTADGDAVCEVFLYSDDRTEKLREYILEACNAYPALTARVKELEEALKLILDDTGHWRAATALNKEPTT